MTVPTRATRAAHDLDAELLSLSSAVIRRRHGLFRLVGSLMLLPWRISRAVTRIVFRLSTVPFRFTAFWVRVMRVRGMVLFIAGLAIGMLVAPWPGRVLRGKLRRLLPAMTPTGDEVIVERVRSELAGAPRTWHLRQPEISVCEGRVTLTGDVATMTARDEFVRLAAGLPGVVSVDGSGLAITPGSKDRDSDQDPGSGAPQVAGQTADESPGAPADPDKATDSQPS